MDVHRCRFVPYQPSAINAVAFSHPKPRTAKHSSVARLAIGRANGDIEIWNPSSGTWHQELVIRGGKDRSIDGLVWINEPDQELGDGRVMIGRSRLFSIGYTSTITEWDLEKAKPKRHASGQHGDIWCLAAQPAGPADGPTLEPQNSNKLIAGTIDGELVMYSAEDDDLRLQRVLVKSPTKKSKMVSITFQSRKVVIVGCSDSTIRAYDIAKGHMLRRMTLGSDFAGGAKDIIVWSVKCLPSGNIVSGDSTGQICIWDGKTYTQVQRIQSHKQDVLSLATSADGTAILSGGMDRRTILYKQNTGAGQRWGKVWGRRYHDHDVKAMASFEHGRISVVVSGGPDANLMVVPLKEMGRENHRMMSNLPQQPPIISASNARFVVSWWDREVHVWVLRKAANELFESGGDGVDINQNRKLLKTIVVKGDSNIASATVNQDGTLLVVSTATDVKAFRLEHQDPAKPSDVKVHSVELPQKLTHLGATQAKLSPDGSWLCLVQEGSQVVMAGIEVSPGAEGSPSSAIAVKPQRLSRLRRHIPRYITNGGLGSYDRSITHVAFSPDSKMAAVADLAGYMDTWILRGHEYGPQNGKAIQGADDDAASSSESGSSDNETEAIDAREQWIRNPNARQLPKLPSAPVVLSFADSVPGSRGPMGTNDEGTEAASDYILAAITSSWNVLAFHPRQGSLTPWARRHPRKSLPAAAQDLLDLPKGVLWQDSRMWVYGVSFLLMLDMGQDLPKHTLDAGAVADSLVAHGMKRKRTGQTTGAGGKMEGENLAPHKVRKHGDDEQYEDIDVGETPRADASDSDNEMPDADGELSQLRNANSGNGGTDEAVYATNERKKWWITYKYRPILGIVPLNTADQPPEIALVERPTWDVEMPERYFAGNEWER
ncbi:U3 small nucleolar RNA-associated protein 4 [Tolypocladium paradoxum]|uniref:U3 small nucleolar RNA-associated protein 4 n=1 Tax=Tolypocladium paradoxum TaxID=94208 RepID=A0A2S4L107_9HYPO|nr:U3 small nucleolar RNA-associated protein 4 [Tolypocladium paradoxum]